MLNLNGYHFQGSMNKEGGEGEYLILPPAYVGKYEVQPPELYFDGLENSKKCYIGYGDPVEGEEYNLYGRITRYYGPYYFNFGLIPLIVHPQWKELISEVALDDETLITDLSNCTVPSGYGLFCYIGEPAASAQWYDELPSDGFCGNFNNGYARKDCYYLGQIVAEYFYNKFKISGGGLYKLNKRYASTGIGGSKKVNIDKDLTVYDGYKSWSTGWLFPGNSAYGFIRNQDPEQNQPQCNKYPFPEVYKNDYMEFEPKLYICLGSDFIYPTIRTYNTAGNIATCSLINFEEKFFNDEFLVERGCSSYFSTLAGPLNISDMVYRFDRKKYPYPNTEMFQPCYHFAYFLTSSKMEVIK